jgi:hypothetical protein
MQRPDPEAITSVREALGSMRESLFVVADAAGELELPCGESDLLSFLQSANYNLSEAERELSVA